MRLSGLARLVTIVAPLVGAGAVPAAAQVLPMDLFRPPAHPVEPPTIASAAQGFTLSTAPLPTASFHAPAAAPGPVAVAEPEPDPIVARAKPAAAKPASPPPSPPERPAATAPAPKVASAEPMEIVPKPVVTAAARIETLSNREIVERANAYFTNLGTLVADFTQVGGDGRRLGGTLYLERPGKVRFDYDPPATLEVIADGSSVAVRDRKLATQDLYSISQTPLKFLLRERVNLGQDIAIRGITNDGDSVRISLEDKSTLGGTSRITLYFDPKVENLSQWRIVDPQGFQTIVVLEKAQRGRRMDPELFKIQYEAIVGSNR
ncbi:outer-membrane lipoprotein carrier protein LolA [Microvirga lenta]|uniref:outer-membrane lipoprotein carrier protein LolA n=1 Tax=Microvirga lenta TaxID=2881337 RepID=UPI001CFC4F66|nr:outer-membrane lipoprotein carrier protein LolA [Microvirga lenta]MCB5174715.1 outer membrane lipoprotein carrier protein LolA [Microvirga lenta]